MENPTKMDDLGGNPLFLETPICSFFWSFSFLIQSSKNDGRILNKTLPPLQSAGVETSISKAITGSS